MKLEIYKYEGRAWNPKSKRSRIVKFWVVKLDDSIWDDFATQKAAKAFAQTLI